MSDLDDYLVSVVYWNNAKQIEPIQMQTVLIVYDDSVWPGVFANGSVVLYPEDFEAVQLTNCDYWAAIPEKPIKKQEKA